MHDDQTNVSDQVETKLTPSPNGPRMAKVLVKAGSGIFKNGQHYPQDSEAVISLQSAQKFEALGEVQILGEVQQGAEAPVAPPLPTQETPHV